MTEGKEFRTTGKNAIAKLVKEMRRQVTQATNLDSLFAINVPPVHHTGRAGKIYHVDYRGTGTPGSKGRGSTELVAFWLSHPNGNSSAILRKYLEKGDSLEPLFTELKEVALLELS